MVRSRILMGLGILFLALQSVNAAPVQTETAIVKRAREFFQALGGSTTAPFPAGEPFTGQIVYRQPRWSVVIPGEATLEIHDRSGAVLSFQNEALSHQLDRDRRSAGPAISKGEAIQSAQAAMTAAGQTKEFKLKQAVIWQISQPPRAAGHMWLVNWTRTANGIPYRNQDATVLLDAETGRVKTLSVSFPTPPPPTLHFPLSKRRATAVAGAVLGKAGVAAKAPVSVSKAIVQPNSFWQPGGQEGQVLPISRAAWICSYQVGARKYEVWVNGKDGAVLGGSLVAPRTRALQSAVPKPR